MAHSMATTTTPTTTTMIDALKIAADFLRDHDLQAMDGAILIAIAKYPGIGAAGLVELVDAPYSSIVSRGLARLKKSGLILADGTKSRQKWNLSEVAINMLNSTDNEPGIPSQQIECLIRAKKAVRDAMAALDDLVE
jgi:hypothetical protein